MTSSWRWFIHPETAISMNRNGSRTLCVFKVHYRDHRAAVGNHRRFTQIQFSDHTGSGEVLRVIRPTDTGCRAFPGANPLMVTVAAPPTECFAIAAQVVVSGSQVCAAACCGVSA